MIKRMIYEREQRARVNLIQQQQRGEPTSLILREVRGQGYENSAWCREREWLCALNMNTLNCVIQRKSKSIEMLQLEFCFSEYQNLYKTNPQSSSQILSTTRATCKEFKIEWIPKTCFLWSAPSAQHLPVSSGCSALINKQTGAGLSPSGSPEQHTLRRTQHNTELIQNTTTVQKHVAWHAHIVCGAALLISLSRDTVESLGSVCTAAEMFSHKVQPTKLNVQGY